MEGGDNKELPRFCIEVNVPRGGWKLAVLQLTQIENRLSISQQSLLHSRRQTYPSKIDYPTDPRLRQCHLQNSFQYSTRLKSMHLVLLAFKSSWRPWKECCMALKLVGGWLTQCPKKGQMYKIGAVCVEVDQVEERHH